MRFESQAAPDQRTSLSWN